jgi:seryl-tRNA synthetase
MSIESLIIDSSENNADEVLNKARKNQTSKYSYTPEVQAEIDKEIEKHKKSLGLDKPERIIRVSLAEAEEANTLTKVKALLNTLSNYAPEYGVSTEQEVEEYITVRNLLRDKQDLLAMGNRVAVSTPVAPKIPTMEDLDVTRLLGKSGVDFSKSKKLSGNIWQFYNTEGKSIGVTGVPEGWSIEIQMAIEESK